MLVSFLDIQFQTKLIEFIIKMTLIVQESMHIIFDESNLSSTEKVLIDDNVDKEKDNEELQLEESSIEYRKSKKHNKEKQTNLD